jgi:mannosyltransferase OCH1-like enzyme
MIRSSVIMNTANTTPLTIPKIMYTVWVGDKPAPMKWINTWKEKHPDWQHILLGNEDVFGRTWRNQRLVDAYREQKNWPGVADLVQYEMLYETGGFMPGADSVCLHPVDELFTDTKYDCYSVYENEIAAPGLISPLLACTKGNLFADRLIEGLKDVAPGTPWKTTGNLYMQKQIERDRPETLMLWPSYTLLPVHWSGQIYKGDEKVYAHHEWGSTFDKQNKYSDGA